MAKRSRALLTDHDRDVYTGDVEADNSTRYEKNSRVRSRIEDELPEDLTILRDAEPSLYLDAMEVVLEQAVEDGSLEELADRRPDLVASISETGDE